MCWRGREQEAQGLATRIAEAQRLKDEGRQIYQPPLNILAVLELGLGRYRQAYDHALPVFQDDRLAVGTFALPELIEAAVRCDDESFQRGRDLRGVSTSCMSWPCSRA